jgi:hypothetical protein
MTLESKWGSLAYNRTAAVPKQQRWLGVNVTPAGTRWRLFWEDLFKGVNEYWSHSIKADRPSYNHIFFKATGPFGTDISVLIDGERHGEYVDIHFTLYKGADPIETQKKRFGHGVSIKDMIQWIDLTAVKWAKPYQRR